MNRSDFQRLADIRIAEAKYLLDGGFYDGAYYLAGYAVECGLKACIANLTNQYDFPPRPEDVRRVYTHNMDELIRSARLLNELVRDMDLDRELGLSWEIVKSWNESSRYGSHSELEARQLDSAVTDPIHGVFTWIKDRWQ